MKSLFRNAAVAVALVLLAGALSGCIIVEDGHRHCGWWHCR